RPIHQNPPVDKARRSIAHSPSLTISPAERISSWLVDHGKTLRARSSRHVRANECTPDVASCRSDPTNRRKRRSIARAPTSLGAGAGRGGKAMAGHPGHGREGMGTATVSPRPAVAESELRAAVSERLGESRFGLWFGDGVRLALNGEGDALEVRVP